MTAKKTIPRLELIERAKREGDQFPLLKELTRLEQELGPERVQETAAYEFATELATVESIMSDIAAGRRLQDYHLHVMAEDMAQSRVPAIPEVAGRRPGFLPWQVEGEIKQEMRARHCVRVLMEIGKKVNVVPPQRTRTALLKQIIGRAVELVEQRFPEARGLIEKSPSKDIRHDLLRRKPTKAVIAYVKKNFPTAEQEMGPDKLPPLSRRAGTL